MERILAIFSYRRPEKLKALKHALKGVKVDYVYHFCDGARGVQDASAVEQNRAAARSFSEDFPQEVILRERNVGLNRNLITGLDHVFSKHRSAIIVEDDVLPRPGFVDFMSGALEAYAVEKDLFSVSAYHPLDATRNKLPELFLSQRFFCWGWASWADKWREIAPAMLKEEPPYRHYWEAPAFCGDDLLWALRNHRIGRKPMTWDQLVALHCSAKGWRHLCPRPLLIENTGFDGSGEHCGPGGEAPVFTRDAIPAQWQWPQPLERDPAIEARITEVYHLPPEPFFKRLRRGISYRLRAHV